MIIYIATNKINGKRYIGATSRSVEHRRARHIYDSKNKNFCRIFGAALRKYGDDGFVWNVIAECSSKEEMMKEEIRLIAEMKPEYNITTGGQGVFGVPYTSERRAKLSKALKGRKMTPEQRVANLIVMRKLSVRHRRPVVCLTDGRFFTSCKEAAAFYGITHGNVRSVAGGGQAKTKGLAFSFSKKPMTPAQCTAEIEHLEKRKETNIRRARSSKCLPVICLTDGKQYKDAKSAAPFYGITPSRVRQLCRFGGASGSGFMFTLVGHDPVKKKELSREQRLAGIALRDAALKRARKTTSKRVICLDDNMVYDSISDAARSIGRCVESVSASIRRKGKAGGKSFRFVEAP
jgi:predicted transcriptional regulator